MDERDITIASLRKQLQEAHKKISALEQEIGVLNYEIDNLKRVEKQSEKKAK